MLSTNQKGVAIFAPLALTVVSVSLFLTKSFHTTLMEKGWTLSAPIAIFFISFWLLFSIATIGNKRFLHEDSIGGSIVDRPGGRLSVDKAVLQNTLEQLLLASGAYIALIHIDGDEAQVYLATLVTLFSVGRACFLFGYRGGAGSRAFGFGLTFYPTVLTYVYIVLKLLIS